MQPVDLAEQRLLLERDPSGEAVVFPLTLAPRQGEHTSAGALAAWVARNSAELRRLARRHGAVLLRGCAVLSGEDFGGVVSSLDCEGYTNLSGALRSSVVSDLVYTANESPPHETIGFHHENAVLSPNPCSFVLFYCETPPTAGGATPLVHSAEVATFLETEYPEFARKAQQLGFRYIRVLPKETDRSSFFGLSWRDAFKVSSREEAERAVEALGSTFQWLDGDDLQTTSRVCPAFRFDERTGQRTFFNSVYGVYFTWNSARSVGEKSVVFGDGSPLDAEAMQGLKRFVEERQVAFEWQQGDILFIDNTLVMHGRQPYTPPRRILASLRGPPVAGKL